MRQGIKCGSNWDCYFFLLGNRLCNFLFNSTYSPSHRRAGTRVINIQSTLHTASDLCKNVSLAVLIGSNGNSYTVSTPSDICVCVCVCVYIYIYIYIYIRCYTVHVVELLNYYTNYCTYIKFIKFTLKTLKRPDMFRS